MGNLTESDTNKVFKKPRGKKKLMIEAMNDHLGVVSIAAKQVGISRETHYHWLKVDKAYKFWSDEAELTLKDFGERTLHRLMKEGNPMIVWNFNKTKNRDRGYGEHIGIEHSVEKETVFNIIVKSVEEIKNEKLNNQPKAA